VQETTRELETSMLTKANSSLHAYRKTAHPTHKGGGQGWESTEVADTLNEYDISEARVPVIVIDNHPADSRVTISKDGVVQTLSGRMGTGGGNTPLVMVRKDE